MLGSFLGSFPLPFYNEERSMKKDKGKEAQEPNLCFQVSCCSSLDPVVHWWLSLFQLIKKKTSDGKECVFLLINANKI